MKNLSKILAMLLVLTMCMSLFCISAFADEISELEPDDEKTEEVKDVKEKPVFEAAPGDEEQPADQKEEPAANEEEPAADEEEPAAELEEDGEEEEEEVENPLAGLLGQDANSADQQINFRSGETVTLTPATWNRNMGNVYGNCSGLADTSLYKNNATLKLCYSSSSASGIFSQLDWYNYGTGAFYISAAALKNLPPDTYSVWIECLDTGNKTNSATLEIEAAPALWPLETPKHVLGSASSLSFVMTDAPGSLVGILDGIGYVMVGDVVLVEGRDYYLTNTEGTQAIITLSPYFLNKLTSGASYTLKVTDGSDLATTSFSIVGYGTSTSSPRTGDESNIGLWAVLLLLSGTAAVVIVPKIKKHG